MGDRLTTTATTTAPSARPPSSGLTVAPGPAVPTARVETHAFREGFVPRPRLVRMLMDSGVPLAVIMAPAGYGKTTLLEEWGQHDPRAFAWVTIHPGHNDPYALVAAVESALNEVAPQAARSRGNLTRSRGEPAAVGRARVARSLVARAPFVLVLDDLQALRATAAWEAVRTLARHVPSGCQLVLASRTAPDVRMARLRANRTIVEVLARDLVMTKAEAAALLERSGLDLAPSDVEALVRRTEGWAAGLYLATVALRESSDESGAVARFGGDDAAVADYVRDEVLSHVSREAVSFLMRTSILERLTGPACDAVLERGDSAPLLSALGRGDMVLVPLDRTNNSYRCHRLIATMLQADLQRLDPGEQRQLHARASDFYAGHAEYERAVHHAVAAGDSSRAARLLAGSAPEYVTPDRHGKLQRWLDRFTSEQITAHPALALAAANDQLLVGELDAVQRLASAARQSLHETPPRERSAALESTVAILHAAVARDGAVRMGEDAARAYELEPEDSPWRPLCCLLDGVSRHLTGDREGSERRLEEGTRRGTVAAPNIQTLCLAQLAVLAAERGDWEGGATSAARATAQVEHYGLGEFPSSALVFAASAVVRAHRGRVEEAQEDVRKAKRLLALLTDFIPWYDAEARVALAWAGLRLSDISGARELLSEAARIARQIPDAVVLRRWIEAASERADAAAGSSPSGRPLLTTAELRILAFLPTHLSFREIAGRVQLSANTVKTQAHAVYRKLDAGSRSEAVAYAAELGLLGQ